MTKGIQHKSVQWLNICIEGDRISQLIADREYADVTDAKASIQIVRIAAISTSPQNMYCTARNAGRPIVWHVAINLNSVHPADRVQGTIH